MNFKLLIPLFLFSLIGQAQSLELSAGAGYSKFFNYGKSENNPEYGGDGALAFSFGFQNSAERNWRLGFELNVLNYGGHFKTRSYGFSHSQYHEAVVRNTSVGLSFYPVNLHLLDDKLRFGFGLGLDYVIASKMDGTGFSWLIDSGPTPDTWELSADQGAKIIGSLVSNLSYAIVLNDQWSLVPKLNYRIGITNDYRYEQSVKKMISSIEIGVSRKL